jgi:hypothetical protein
MNKISYDYLYLKNMNIIINDLLILNNINKFTKLICLI